MSPSPMPGVAAMDGSDVTTAGESTATVSGMILPPPDIRDLVEKTAPFVARNGASFEDRLREKGEHSEALSSCDSWC